MYHSWSVPLRNANCIVGPKPDNKVRSSVTECDVFMHHGTSKKTNVQGATVVEY